MPKKTVSFTVTSAAIRMISEMEKESGLKPDSENIRLTIYSTGVGCGGPSLKAGFKNPLPSDIERTVSGCKFFIRESIIENLNNAVIDSVETFWGPRLNIKTEYGCI